MKAAIRGIAFALCIGSLSAVATAGNQAYENLTYTVKFADLDLARAPGAAVLYARIRSAAQRVCAPLDARAPEASVASYRCTKQAIARAVHDVNAPMLTSYYLRKTNALITVAQR